MSIVSNTINSALSTDRISLYENLNREIDEQLVLRDITSSLLSERGHQNWIWDATHLPTNSHYVPVFVKLLFDLEREGVIHPDTHILVETTTGNAGTAIAYLAGILGYQVIIFMPEDMPSARIRDIQAVLPDDGSELRLTQREKYVKGTVKALQRFLIQHKNEKYGGKALFPVNHSRRARSSEAIEECIVSLLSTMPLSAIPDTAVVALGNGTTATGIARAIRQYNPSIRIVGVEPVEAPCFYIRKFGKNQFRKTYSAEPNPQPHKLIGTGGWGVEFPNLDVDLLNDIELVAEDEWRIQLEKLEARQFSVGHSSAACQAVVERLSAGCEGRNNNFFSVFYDPLSKYQGSG